MVRLFKVSISSIFLLVLTINMALAQEQPRPTPTNVPGVSGDVGQISGTIRGAVYEDVNGDGRCLDTGIVGEGPVANIPIEFVSSDEKTVVTLYTGNNGTYGLAGAGQSYWAVSAKPGPEWIVTSPATVYAPIFEDNQVQTGINFCVMKTAGGARVRAILPAAGSPASPLLTILAGVGVGFMVIGLGLVWQQRRRQLFL